MTYKSNITLEVSTVAQCILGKFQLHLLGNFLLSGKVKWQSHSDLDIRHRLFYFKYCIQAFFLEYFSNLMTTFLNTGRAKFQLQGLTYPQTCNKISWVARWLFLIQKSMFPPSSTNFVPRVKRSDLWASGGGLLSRHNTTM